MKHINLFACMLLAFAGKAQTKGTITFGANVLSSSINSFEKTPLYQQNLQSRIGYFATNKLAVGFCLETNINNNQSVPFGATVFTRLYTGKKEHQVVKFFVEAGAGAAHHIVKIEGTEKVNAIESSSFKPAAYVSPGVSLFIGSAVALEVAPEYRYISGPTAAHRLGASAGIKFFLSEQAFKKAFPHTFVKPF